MRLRRETGDFSINVVADMASGDISVTPTQLPKGLGLEDFVGQVVSMLTTQPDEADPSKTISTQICDIIKPAMRLGEDVITLELPLTYILHYTRSTGALSPEPSDSVDDIPGLDNVG